MLDYNKKINFEVFLIATIDDEIINDTNIILFTKGQTVKLFPVYLYKKNYYSELKEIIINNKPIKTKPLKANMKKTCWSEITPIFKQDGYDNFNNTTKNKIYSYIDPIIYKSKHINNNKYFNVDEVLTQYNYGTKYISINENINNISCFDILSNKNIVQLVKRPDNLYTGYLQELMNTPFILCPKNLKPNMHQTDFRIGSDCVSFSIYGQRRLGNNIPYVSPSNVYKYFISNNKKNCYPKDYTKNSLIVNESLDEIPTPKVGSVFHYGEHVAVFFEDRGVIDKLDMEDLIIHSIDDKPSFCTLYENYIRFGNFSIHEWLWIK